MYAEPIKNLKDVRTVLDNLNIACVNELKKLFGNDYKKQVFQIIRAVKKEKYLIRLKSTNEPVGVFGLIPINKFSGGVFLLTCDNLHDGNIITFLRSARRKINDWCNRYKLLIDSCDKQNETIKKWLSLLGFKPSDYEDDNFIDYYKGNIDYYEK